MFLCLQTLILRCSCLLVVLTTSLQVSVYAPVENPLTQRWVEVGTFLYFPVEEAHSVLQIADLTMLTKELLPPKEILNGLTSRGMLEMRASSELIYYPNSSALR